MKSQEPHHDPLATPHAAFQSIQHKHPEAFRLMVYQTEDGETVETIWNSRDGEAPLQVSSSHFTDLAGEAVPMHQVMAHGDTRSPLHVPNIGDRIFVGLTPERRQFNLRIFAREHSTGEPDDVAGNLQALLDDPEIFPVGSPELVTVTSDTQSEFINRRMRAGNDPTREWLTGMRARSMGANPRGA